MKKLHIETLGDGPDLVLLHGWGMHGGVWQGMAEALSRRFRVHLVDLPGYGGSAASTPYTLEPLARAVAAALPEKAHVCGWSLGGMVALTLARRFPQRVRRLVLTAGTPCFTTREGWAPAVAPAVFRDFARSLEGDYEGTLKRFLSLQARGGDDARGVIKRLREALFARGRPAAEVLRAGLDILLEADLRAEAGTVAQPVLLVHGDRDTLAPVGAAYWLADSLPEARLAVIAGAAHAPFLSHPQSFAEVVTGFLCEQ